MHQSVMDFCRRSIKPSWVKGAKVLEVGAYNVNGSARPWLESLGPDMFMGTDVRDGPCVDVVVPAERLDTLRSSWDLVVCLETVEHIGDWNLAIQAMKDVLKPNGHIVITTRSEGFGLHEYPADHWRFSKDDMVEIFGDFELVNLEDDPDGGAPGVFVVAKKPKNYKPGVDYEKIHLYNINLKRRVEPYSTIVAVQEDEVDISHRRVSDSEQDGMEWVDAFDYEESAKD